jgi:SAM-dependent methyltransferase
MPMSFDVPADAYERFMGRFSGPLAGQFAGWLRLAPGQRALDVGCGPGALTAVLAAELGVGLVSAVDPSESFVAAVRERLPGVDARRGAGEALPWPDGTFDAAASQLAVHLMADPLAGVSEMARVTRPGGTVAATVWDFAGGTAPVSAFWRAAREIDPSVPDKGAQPGASDGQLAGLLSLAGLEEAESAVLAVSVRFSSFDDWWQSFTVGVGPPGAYLASLDHDRQAALRAGCARLLPQAPFTLTARSWTARARAK